MNQIDLLRRHGLFDTNVPRYTSYPPATRFQPELGAQRQPDWMRAVQEGEEISLYIHIPFCRRLCWFCACRTQGTQTLGPVDNYIAALLAELEAVRQRLPQDLRLARLHLGGGTPTLLTRDQMTLLLSRLFQAFPAAQGLEFSVEIDPTEAAPGLISLLAEWGMNRASVGVQDFGPVVQQAIGREQSYEETSQVIDQLRGLQMKSVNIDLLYGLPHQTPDRLNATLDRVLDLMPDRLALFGYAHVPHMSKRQVLIDGAALPSAEDRFRLTTLARHVLLDAGYLELGIDHFAKPGDSLARAKEAGTLRRNFQGYTDDPCETLIGLGASAISKYREGYVQNAVATAAYQARVAETGLTAAKGYALTPEDQTIARLVEGLMCYGACAGALDDPYLSTLAERFPDAIDQDATGLRLRPEAMPLVRIIAACLDTEQATGARFSLAV